MPASVSLDSLLKPGKFPKRDEALEKLKPYSIAHIHDDGDLTIISSGKLYVVTTEGQVFERVPTEHLKPGYLEPFPAPLAEGEVDGEIVAGLEKSVKEEQEAADAYHSRGISAQGKGDVKTSSLYSHIRGEELTHKKEFTERKEEKLGFGETINGILPMSPEKGPPLPRALKIKWPKFGR